MIARRRYEFPAGLGRMVTRAAMHGELSAGPGSAVFAQMLADHFRDGARRSEGRLRSDGVLRPDVVLTASGRAALATLLRRLGVATGRAILVPAWTFAGVTDFLRREGWPVRLCDVGREAPLMDASTLAAAWHEDVACVLYTHLFGRVADAAQVVTLAHERGAVVIEDCAHALGSHVHDRPVGLQGDGALFSFDLLKPVACFGGGLALLPRGRGRCTVAGAPQSSAQVLQRVIAGVLEDGLFAGPWLRPLSAALAHPGGRALVAGVDRLLGRRSAPAGAVSHLQGRVGMAQLLDLEPRLMRRRQMARRVLGALGLHDPQLEEDAPLRNNAYFNVVRTAPGQRASQLRAELLAAGIDAGVGGDIADDLSACVPQPMPGARDWADRAVQLPGGAAFSEAVISELCLRLAPFRGRFVR